MKYFLLLCLFSLASLKLMAQQRSIELLTISGQYGSPQPYEETQAIKATESVGLINLKVPVVLSASLVWFSNLTYTRSIVKADSELPQMMTNPIDLHGIILQTGLVKQISGKSAVQLLFSPRLMTDFEDVNSRSYQFGGIALYERKYHEGLTMRYGAMYNRDLFGHFIVPLVYIDRQFSGSKWSISGLLPIYGKVNYRVNDNLSVGLSHFALVTSYQLGSRHLGDYMERKSIDLTMYLRKRIIGNVHLEARAGYSMGRDYLQFEMGDELNLRISAIDIGDERIRKNYELRNGPIANLRIVYDLPIDN